MTNVPWKQENIDEYLDLVYNTRSGDKWSAPIITTYLNDNKTHLTDSEVTTIAKTLEAIFGLNWEKTWNAINNDYNPLSNYHIDYDSEINDNRNETSQLDSTVANTVNKTRNETYNGTSETTDSSNNTLTGNDTIQTDNNVYGFNSSLATGQDNSSTVDNNTETNVGNSSSATEDNKTTSTTNTGSDNTSTESSETKSNTSKTTEKYTKDGNIGVMIYSSMLKAEIEVRKWNFFEKVFADIDSLLTLSVY